MRSKCYILCAIAMVLICSVNTVKAQESPKLRHDIELLLGEKNSRTPAQQKIDSRLLQAVRESRGQKMVDGVDLEPANVNADATGKLTVDISATVTEDLLAKIEALGGHVIYPSWEYHSIRAELNLSAVETLAAHTDVSFIQPAVIAMTVGSDNTHLPHPVVAAMPMQPHVNSILQKAFSFTPKKVRIPFAQRAVKVRAQLTNYLKQYNTTEDILTGLVNSQGDHAHRADDVRNTYGYEGQGIKIGVLSDSYNALGVAATDVANGELPGVGNPLGNTTPVTVLVDFATGSDEGRAMLQIVHDVAPKAQLYFASAFISEASFASNITALRNAPNNCDIIIDDIFYFDEPVFQDGIVAQAVNTVTAGGALYFSSAGNEGSLGKGTSGYYEGDFNDAGSPVFNPPGGKTGTIHNFGTVGTPVNGDIILSKNTVYNLNWADPSGASGNDYDLFLVSSGGTIKGSSTNVQSGTQNPYEQVSASPTLVAGDRLIVYKTTAAAVRAFAINTIRGTLTVATNGQIHGHTAAVNAFSVAATPAVSPGPFPGVFVAANQVETFSSDGLRRVFYNPTGTAITPGNFLFGTNGGTVRNKPDITAADGVSTTLGASSGLNPFYGTSAAAPHAGAIAALLKSSNPALTAAQIRTALVSTALDIEGAGYDNLSGSGIVQAFQAMQSLSPTPVSNIVVGTVTVSEGATGTNSNTYVEPGENGTMLVQLTDPSLVNATGVTAVLTSSTAGVTITQGNASYGTITASGGNATNTGTPYAFTVSNALACGAIMNFTLTVTFGGGGTSPKVFLIRKALGFQPGLSINSSLGAVPPTGAGFTSTSGQQTGRISRSGVSSTCAVPKANPGLTTAVGSRQYDAYTFTNTNTTSQCVTVIVTAANGVNLYTAAFNNVGFVPATPSTNYLADPGSSSASMQYSFTAPAGQPFTIVVHDVNVLPTSGSSYNLSVSLANCAAAGPLPVTWLDFTATLKTNKQVALNWKVENEINVSRYEVEYSVDGTKFSPLYTVPASAANTAQKAYSQNHPFPADGLNYYRIKQVDVDGRYSYSKTVAIKIDNPNTISITPNPASAFVLVQSRSAMSRIQLYSSTGQLVADVVPAGNSYRLPLDNVAAGQYFLRIETKDGVINKKISKE
ncbi:S8 family serine peptidase [Ferruginibacter profundus]